MKRKVFTMTLLLVGLLFSTTNNVAQTTCADALTTVTGANQAPVGNELWYTFSPSGQPLANYWINYDSKSFDIKVTIYSGSCGHLEEIPGHYIPAISNDENTYYIRFVWQGTPQAFDWELYQQLVVLPESITVTPGSIGLNLGESYDLGNLTVSVLPTDAPGSYRFTTDNHAILALPEDTTTIWGSKKITAKSTGTALLIFTTVTENLKDTVVVNVSAPSLCGSATTITTGENTAQAVSEEWLRFTANKTGIHSISYPEGSKINASWTVYQGDCDNLRTIEQDGNRFYAEAGNTYSMRINQYGDAMDFQWILNQPVSLTAFSLTIKELKLPLGGDEYYLIDLGLNFTPADASDKGITIEVRDANVVELNEDGEDVVSNDIIRPKNEGSTYVVFTTHDGGFKDSCRVTVERVSLISFSLSIHEKKLRTPYNYGFGDIETSASDTLNIASLGLTFNPADAADKSYTVLVRDKSIVQYRSDDGNEYLQAKREGSAYVVFATNDGNLQDSILINVARVVNGGEPCLNATVARVGYNTMPSGLGTVKWYTFMPEEPGNYAMENWTEKYPVTGVELYEGDCSELRLINDGTISGIPTGHNYGFGFYGEAGNTYYLKLTTLDYNYEYPREYEWVLANVSVGISGKVTYNGAAVQGKVELYVVRQGATILLQTTDIGSNGNYSFSNLGVESYIVKAITADGNITYYGNTVNSKDANSISTTKEEILTGKNIAIIPASKLNEGSSVISGYVYSSTGDQQSPAVRRVAVESSGNTAAGNVSVLLQRDGNTIAYTQTNSNGYFEFTGVGVGEYTVVIDIPGLEMENLTTVNITESAQTVELAYEVSEAGIEETTDNATHIVETAIPSINIYPNPTKGTVHIEGVDNPDVKIYSTQGALILQTNGNQVDLSKFVKGMYILQVGDSRMTVIKE